MSATFEAKAFEGDQAGASEQGRLLSSLVESAKLSVISAVDYRCDERWSLKPRRLRDSYWSMVLSGCGSCKIGGGRRALSFEAGPGDLLLFPEGVLHELTPKPGSRMAMVNVHFWLHALGSLDVLGLCGASGLFKDDGSLARKGLFAELSLELAREHGARPPGWRQALEAGTWRLLLPILRESARKRLPRMAKEGGAAAELMRLRPAFETVDARIADSSLSVAELAAAVGVSQVYLRRLFQRAVGRSPVAFIQSRRVALACKLLKRGGMPVKELAAACGFSEIPFFYRVFRNIAGCTPGAYRSSDEF